MININLRPFFEAWYYLITLFLGYVSRDFLSTLLIKPSGQNTFQMQASILLTQKKFSRKVTLKRRGSYDDEEMPSRTGRLGGSMMEIDDNNSSVPNIALEPLL